MCSQPSGSIPFRYSWSGRAEGRPANYICSGDGDGFLKLWDLSWFSGARARPESPARAMSTLSTTAGHEKDVNTVAFSPDGAYVCSGSQDKTAKLWSVPSLATVRTFRGHGRGVWSVAFSPVDQVLCTASGDKTLRLWSLKDGACLRSFQGHTSSVLKCCYVSYGVQVVSAGADGLVKVWNVSNAECANTFDQHEDKVWDLTACDQGETQCEIGTDISLAPGECKTLTHPSIDDIKFDVCYQGPGTW